MSEFNPSCVLVTGGAGFIGSNLIRLLLDTDPNLRVVNLDLLTYAGNLESLESVTRCHGVEGDGRYFFVHGDIRDGELVGRILAGEAYESSPNGERRPTPLVDAVMHLAAESHVDRSILGPSVFVDTNIRGTLSLLDACRAELARAARPFRYLHVSTDEVYGSLGPDDPPFTERTPLAPNSPYAASKAGSDLLVRAYVETYGFPALITRCSNNYGPFQFPEKLLPLMITRAVREEALPVYGDGLNVRDWLYVEDHAEALWTVLRRGKLGEVYNIGGESEIPNIEVVRAILGTMNKPESLIRYVTDRPGHDRRYAMDIARIRHELGWQPRRTFEEGLRLTVEWYLGHPRWWERVLSEAYKTAAAMYIRDEQVSRAHSSA